MNLSFLLAIQSFFLGVLVTCTAYNSIMGERPLMWAGIAVCVGWIVLIRVTARQLGT